VRRGELDPADIDDARLRRGLWQPELPDPDLVIRTGGEMRLSNFLVWQAAYAEFWSTPTPWPDFREPGLHAAFAEFHRRQRRFGLTGEQAEAAEPT
jgi:undecaprenyl diphosphate synthase